MRENGGRWEQREGIVHIGGEDVAKAANSSSPGVIVSESAIVGLPISLDKAIDV